jgi:hypothetical protein
MSKSKRDEGYLDTLKAKEALKAANHGKVLEAVEHHLNNR